jgi:hypothetical protein
MERDSAPVFAPVLNDGAPAGTVLEGGPTCKRWFGVRYGVCAVSFEYSDRHSKGEGSVRVQYQTGISGFL